MADGTEREEGQAATARVVHALVLGHFRIRLNRTSIPSFRPESGESREEGWNPSSERWMPLSAFGDKLRGHDGKRAALYCLT
jgi:hypothetical protein